MGIASIIALVLELIKGIPQLIELIKVIKQKIEEGQSKAKVNDELKKLTLALKSKDAQALYNIFNSN